MQGSQDRKLSVKLIVGIVLLPIVFAWFTLRDGYSKQVRTASFIWLFLVSIIWAVTPSNTNEKHVVAKNVNDAEVVVLADNSNSRKPVDIKTRINQSVYIPYSKTNNEQAFNLFNARLKDIEILRQQVAENAITSRVCNKVESVDVELDSDITNLEFSIWCKGRMSKKYQIFADEYDIKFNAPLKKGSKKAVKATESKIDEGVYIPYSYENNKQIFDRFGAQRVIGIQQLREKLAEQAIASGKCTEVTMSEVSIDGDINNPNLYVWCYTEASKGSKAKEYQIYATENDIKNNAPLLGLNDRGLSDSEATTICRRQILNNTKEYSDVKVHYLADQTFFKKTDGSSIIKVGVTITNDFGVKLPHLATCGFDENGSITYFDILRGSR